VTTNQVLLGVGLILVLAVGSQVLASRLRIPALIVLLPVGFTAGAITTDVNPQDLLGAAFQPLVSLAVAVILYDSGMSLNLRKLHGHTRRIVVRLIVMGVPVTMAFAAVFSGLLLNMSPRAAVMLGAILVVSGPTVVGPLLGFIRPTERLQHVLSWEGSLIDPVGGVHRDDVLGRARLPAHPGRVQDPSGHVPGHRGHRGRLRPDGGAGGQAARRHPSSPYPAVAGGRRGVGGGLGACVAIAGPGGLDVGGFRRTA
jgi:Sodium/hydrogen exchanger family